MKEGHILFSAPMVRALLDGRKTQTRRVMKPQPTGQVFVDGQWLDGHHGESGDTPLHCPYGQPGDRLWVKETWRVLETSGSTMRVQYPHTASELHFTRDQIPHNWRIPKASARGNVSPLFMPRWASRITLEVTGVRVERLQECSQADAIAEGLERDEIGGYCTHDIPGCFADPVEAYRVLWEHINGAGSWAANPWVWVVEFKRMQP